MSGAESYVTAWVASGAYNKAHYRKESATFLGHVCVAVGSDIQRVLCSRVKVDSILPDSATFKPPQEATCPTCLRRWGRELTASLANAITGAKP